MNAHPTGKDRWNRFPRRTMTPPPDDEEVEGRDFHPTLQRGDRSRGKNEWMPRLSFNGSCKEEEAAVIVSRVAWLVKDACGDIRISDS